MIDELASMMDISKALEKQFIEIRSAKNQVPAVPLASLPEITELQSTLPFYSPNQLGTDSTLPHRLKR